MLLVHIRDLIGAHTEIRQDHKQRAGNEGHREHACLFGTDQLRGDDGKYREDHAPCAHANSVPDEVSRGAMRGVFFLLIGKRAFGERSHHAIEPLIHQARDEILLMHARFLALSRSFLQAWLRGVLRMVCRSAVLHSHLLDNLTT